MTATVVVVDDVVDVVVEVVDVVLDVDVVVVVVVVEVDVGTVVVVVVVEVVRGTVVVDDVDVVVVVGFGITKPFAQPHLMSIGAPTGVPAAIGILSIADRNCVQPSHADTPVVGHPPARWLQAAVCTVIAARRSGFDIAIPLAAITAH